MKKKYIYYILILITVIFLWIKDLVWLSFSIILFRLFYDVTCYFLSKIGNNLFKTISSTLIVFFAILSIAVFVRLLIFDVYKIPSASMENTLYKNDVILVNKLMYGPKLPQSYLDIPLLNIVIYFNQSWRINEENHKWSYRRVLGYSKIKKGDIFVFDMMFSENKMTIVKRCIGIPGTILEIKNGDVLINNNKFNPTDQIKNNYRYIVKNKDIPLPKSEIKNFDLIQENIINNTDWENSLMSIHDKNIFINLGAIDSVQRIIDKISETSSVYPYSSHNNWNWDNYGPLKIPAKGMEIKLTPDTYALYRDIIQKYEKEIIEEIDGEFYINHEKRTNYKFKQNYYFMMGDNRKSSHDSRVWGLIPDEFIVGKVSHVLYSNRQDKFQWDRLYKKVH